ncbi:hypothetical protein AgCh_010071 [Apium graveolens]
MFNNATGTSVTASVKVWQMNSANLKPYPLTEDQIPLQDQDKRDNSPAGLQRPIKGLFYILIVSSCILLVSVIQGPKIVNDGDANDHVSISLYSSLKAMLPEHLEQQLEDVVEVWDEKAEANPWGNEMLHWQRTSYHFQPQKNWMNGKCLSNILSQSQDINSFLV